MELNIRPGAKYPPPVSLPLPLSSAFPCLPANILQSLDQSAQDTQLEPLSRGQNAKQCLNPSYICLSLSLHPPLPSSYRPQRALRTLSLGQWKEYRTVTTPNHPPKPPGMPQVLCPCQHIPPPLPPHTQSHKSTRGSHKLLYGTYSTVCPVL